MLVRPFLNVGRALSLAFFILLASPSLAIETYYGEKVRQNLEHSSEASEFRKNLQVALAQAHLPQKDQPDLIQPDCQGAKNCYQHRSLGYTVARRMLFGRLHLKRSPQGYELHCVYCNRELQTSDFAGGQTPAPDTIPDPRVVNAEHTWPQSKFSPTQNKDMQKSDLHILFPTTAKANSLRGNHPFGEVLSIREKVCPESKLGFTQRANSDATFEPPENHRGNVARALFYFAVRYNLPIDENQESFLRRWHRQDPVNSEEEQRNQEIFALQFNRNPFIDHPEWVDLIPDL